MSAHRGTAAILLAAVSALSACGGSAAPRASDTSNAPAATVGSTPSTTTRMICTTDGQREIRAAVGVATIRPVVGRWNPPRYSCDYVYADGAFTLSVQQLPNEASTTQYYTALATKLDARTVLRGLGQGATTTSAGTVIVRKDTKVLVVDPHRLPVRFGTPPDTRANVALTIAATIMGCWTES